MATKKRKLSSYEHRDEERTNNPPAGLVTPESDPDAGTSQTYSYDPHLDPELQWAGKAERTSFEVPTQSLHVHERIDSHTILEAVKKRNGSTGTQLSLFEEERDTPYEKAIEFYQHDQNWSNRLIAGDSLLVMNSLLYKESMAGKVQCFYMDPPYGITYGSNFQPFTDQRTAQDGKDQDLTAEPEMIKAFRDTWELGIHSYLSYMRDRLLLARELLTDSGSVFVQIGDENVHRVGLLMDDLFGAENRIATISFATTSGSSTQLLPQTADYLLWYAKDKTKVKYRQLYEPLTRAEIVDYFNWDVMVELPDGTCRKLTTKERFDPDKHLPKGARIYRRTGLDSQGVSTTGRSEPYVHQGRTFHCSKNRQWSISEEGMNRLAEQGRLEALEGQNSLRWKQYEDEVPGRRINNIWPIKMYPNNKRYVVETSAKAIQRCLLMTTDPGDLIFDPTCGSGTTAFVAEQWGRRWITCDTSRVALTLAKQRLMTAHFDYYQLKYPEEGVGSGFQYKTVNKISPSILSETAPPSQITVYDQPLKDTQRARITGPFTVEAVPAPICNPITAPPPSNIQPNPSVTRQGETLRQHEWRDELQQTGIRGKGGQHIALSNIEPLPCRWLHANAETKPDDPLGEYTHSATSATDYELKDRDSNTEGNQPEVTTDDKQGIADGNATTFRAMTSTRRAVISFGPEHAPLEKTQVGNAVAEAQTFSDKPDLLIFAAFQFDPEADKDIDEFNAQDNGIQLLQVHMNADLQTKDLKKKRASNESFWLIGQPDITVEAITSGENAGKYRVKVHGFDYFNTANGELEEGGKQSIAVWMLDTDYDGRSLYPRQIFFPMSDDKGGWSKLAKNLKAEIDPERIEAYRGTEALPFESGEHRTIAVKIVDNRGIESLRVLALPSHNEK